MNKKIAALLMAVLMLVCCACGKKEEEAGTLSLETFEAADSFINDIYSEFGAEELPMMLMQTELPMEDAEMLSFNSGITDTTGINSVIVSESATGSIAYSMVYVIGAEDADADAILAQIMENIDPRKWICVAAEKQAGFTMGNDVFFVMGATDMIDTIVEHAQTKAEALGFVCGAVEEQVG